MKTERQSPPSPPWEGPNAARYSLYASGPCAQCGRETAPIGILYDGRTYCGQRCFGEAMERRERASCQSDEPALKTDSAAVCRV